MVCHKVQNGDHNWKGSFSYNMLNYDLPLSMLSDLQKNRECIVGEIKHKTSSHSGAEQKT